MFDNFFQSSLSFKSIDTRSDGVNQHGADGPSQNKLNVNAPEFKLKLQYEQPFNFPQLIKYSKSSGNIIQLAATARRNAAQMATLSSNQPTNQSHPSGGINVALSSERVQINVRV